MKAKSVFQQVESLLRAAVGCCTGPTIDALGQTYQKETLERWADSLKEIRETFWEKGNNEE